MSAPINSVKPFAEPLWKEVSFYPVETESEKPYTVKYRVRYAAVRLMEIQSKLRRIARDVLVKELSGKVTKEQQAAALRAEYDSITSEMRNKNHGLGDKERQAELASMTKRKQDITTALAEMGAGIGEPWVSEYDISVYQEYRSSEPEYVGPMLDLLLVPVDCPPVAEMLYDIPEGIISEAMSFFTPSTEEPSKSTTVSGPTSEESGTGETRP